MKRDTSILSAEYGPNDEGILDLAIKQDKYDLVQVLMDIGVPLEKRDSDGKTALRRAAEENNAPVIKLLIKGGADKETLADDNLTPLYAAADEGLVDATRALIDGGANLEFKSSSGRTPLMTSIFTRGGEETSALLIDAGTDLTTKYNGGTALHWAAAKKTVATVEKLIEAGIDVTATNSGGRTALVNTLTQSSNPPVELVDALMVKEALSSREPVGNRNILNLLLYNNMPTHVAKILQVGFSGPSDEYPFSLDENDGSGYGGKAPLEQAVSKKFYDQAFLLLEHEFDVDVVSTRTGDFMYTPLMWAATQADDDDVPRNLELVQKLLDKGAKLDKQMSTGRTPLMLVYGATPNSIEVLLAMLDSLGPDEKSVLDVKNRGGETALRIHTSEAFSNRDRPEYLGKVYPLVLAGASFEGIIEAQKNWVFRRAVEDKLYGVANNIQSGYATLHALFATSDVSSTNF